MATSLIPFVPRVNRYPAPTSHVLSEISAALATIRNANVLPAIADQLRSSALAGTVHYSNMIEGNDLPFIEAQRAAEGKLDTTTRSKMELVNYVAALDLIDAGLESGNLDIDEEFLLKLHGTLTKGLGRPEDEHFQPQHEGAWRDGTAVVVDPITGTIMHEGSAVREVRPRMLGLFEWIHEKNGSVEWPPFVIAGIAHYAITDIHPFADGNGRTARLLQVAILMNAGALPGRLFSFERYYASDKSAYLRALRSAGKPMATLNEWIDYFLAGLLEEYERIASTVSELNALTTSATSKYQLSRTQETAVSKLRIDGVTVFSRREYESASGLARSSATADLGGLVDAGLIETVGGGPNTRYRFRVLPGAATQPAAGRPREWTEDRIRASLSTFLEGREKWPGPAVFREAGFESLYIQASRRGGIRRWRREFGF